MRKMLLALALTLPALTTAHAIASETTDAMAPVHQFVQGFNKGDMKLYTNEINYDMNSSIGYYLVSGRIVNKENELISKQGHYYAKTNDIYFKNNVVLTHLPTGQKKPDFVINCDTMRYNSVSKITYFYGPTNIKNEENLIYCEDGWYHTEKELSRFSKNSYILTTEQKMWGDSVFYDGKQSIGRAFGNVQIIDTTQKTIIKGDYAIHYELTDLSIVTGNALFIKPFTDDTLFLHADTLKAKGEGKSKKVEVSSTSKVKSKKSTEKQETKNQGKEKRKKKKQTEVEVKSEKTEDQKLIVEDGQQKKEGSEKQKGEPNHLLFAYHKVKFFKKDFQGKCDSLYYSTNDSVMKMYGKPVFWSSENQLTADSAKMYTGKKSLKSIELEGNGFIVSEKDSVHYNQIRGKKMRGFFNDSTLYLIKVEGNGQTIYYDEENDELRAVNRADCTNINVYLKNKKISRIVFITKPDATLFPIDEIDVRDFKLKGFIWRNDERPLKLADIFIW